MGFRAYLDELLELRRRAGVAPNLIVVERLDSTQRLAGRMVEEYLEQERQVPAAAVLAYEQTAGRGRRGRAWWSPPGAGALVTLVRTLTAGQPVGNLPLLMAVSLAEALEPYLEGGCQLKWPNDLLVGRHKLGGILIDARSRSGGQVVALLGFGVNLSRPPAASVPRGVTSLEQCCPAPPSLAQLTWRLLAGIDCRWSRLADLPWLLTAYRRRLVHRPGEALLCRVGERTVEGLFRGLDEGGGLLLETSRGEERIAAGEILERGEAQRREPQRGEPS